MYKIKKLIEKFKNWLIRKLGGYTANEAENRLITSLCYYGEQADKPWKVVVREICRKSENSYYDWACEYCGLSGCGERNGWCEHFYPAVTVVASDE